MADIVMLNHINAELFVVNIPKKLQAHRIKIKKNAHGTCV